MGDPHLPSGATRLSTRQEGTQPQAGVQQLDQSPLPSPTEAPAHRAPPPPTPVAEPQAPGLQAGRPRLPPTETAGWRLGPRSWKRPQEKPGQGQAGAEEGGGHTPLV